jgi:hypothetical protein
MWRREMSFVPARDRTTIPRTFSLWTSHYTNWAVSAPYPPFFLVEEGRAADATDAPQPWGFLCNPVMKMTMMMSFCPFPSNEAPVEWNWQGKTEVLGEKLVPVPLCPPQIPHGLTRDRTRAAAVGGRRITAWAMARPGSIPYLNDIKDTRFLVLATNTCHRKQSWQAGILFPVSCSYLVTFAFPSVHR